jgi:hypothetical protein
VQEIINISKDRFSDVDRLNGVDFLTSNQQSMGYISSFSDSLSQLSPAALIFAISESKKVSSSLWDSIVYFIAKKPLKEENNSEEISSEEEKFSEEEKTTEVEVPSFETEVEVLSGECTPTTEERDFGVSSGECTPTIEERDFGVSSGQCTSNLAERNLEGNIEVVQEIFLDA